MRVKRDWRMASKEVYEGFLKKYPDSTLSYNQWEQVIYQFNYNFRDYLLDTGEKVKTFWGVGDFAIKKRKVKKIVNYDGKDRIKLPIDWEKTKKLGKKVYHFNYHTDGYRFAYKWFIDTSRFKYSHVFVFKPYRESSRLIKKYIDKGYGDKYLEWELFKK